MKIKIVTPYGIIYSDEGVESVTLPTTTGVITVKDEHVPLISTISPGEIEIDKESHTATLAVSRGVIEVRDKSELVVLADTAERAEDIDIERAEEARARAEEYLKKEDDLADVEFAKLQAKIEKEFARINVAKKYRKLGNTDYSSS